MTKDKLERVTWRLQEMKTNRPGIYTNKQIRLAIMEEIGTGERTINRAIRQLLELKMMQKAEFGSMKLLTLA